MTETCEIDGCEEPAHSVIESGSVEMTVCETHVRGLLFDE